MSTSNTKEYYHRRLPHYLPALGCFFVTFRLIESVPIDVLQTMLKEHESEREILHKIRSQKTSRSDLHQLQARQFDDFDKLMARYTSYKSWLNNPDVASVVARILKEKDSIDYDMYAYCIMPNHVHTVFATHNVTAEERREPCASPVIYPIAKIVRQWKGKSARLANKLLHRAGAFWHHESYDHQIRDDDGIEKVVKYVAYNPVKAGLVKDWKDWPWTYCKWEL